MIVAKRFRFKQAANKSVVIFNVSKATGSKLVKQEVSCAVILPLIKKLSIFWLINHLQ